MEDKGQKAENKVNIVSNLFPRKIKENQDEIKGFL